MIASLWLLHLAVTQFHSTLWLVWNILNMWNMSGFTDPSFPSENVKTIFISKLPVGKAGVSPTSWQVYGNPSLQGHRTSMCYTMIQKVMLRKSLFKVGGRVTWTNSRDVQRASCYTLVQSAHGIGEAETNLCSIEAEFHWHRSGNKHQKKWLLILVIPACSSSLFVCVYYREIYNAIGCFLSYSILGQFCVVWDVHEE